LQRQKEGITKPQIVAGREFKGTSFISKPETIFFKVRLDVIFSSNFKIFIGFHCRSISFANYFGNKRVVLFQLVQIDAIRGQNKRFLPHRLHPNGKDVCRSLHDHPDYLHPIAKC
jgi:hypothetical protein